MKKNSVYKTVKWISGGVLAPDRFWGNALYIPLVDTRMAEMNDRRENLAVIVCKKHASIACVYPNESTPTACSIVTKRHLERGLARAVFFNGELANADPENATTVELLSAEIAKYLQVPDEEIIMATTGKMGEEWDPQIMFDAIKPLVKNISDEEGVGERCARAISTLGKERQAAFSFELGSFHCKIGAMYASYPSTSCVLTTDVNITSKCLQKALSVAVKDTFSQLIHKGANSLNDTICMLANGEAGNYCISCEDTEYGKFLGALEEVLTHICKDIAKQRQEKALLYCIVDNASSKRAARAFARSVVSSHAVLESVIKKEFDVQSILTALHASGERLNWQDLSIVCKTKERSFILFEDGVSLKISKALEEEMLSSDEIELYIDFYRGNYWAQAFVGVNL